MSTRSRDALQVAGGCLLGLVFFWVLNWASVNTLYDSTGAKASLLVGGAAVLLATIGALQFPLSALGGGAVMVALVLVGWVSADALEAFGRTETDLPSDVIAFGSYAPLVLGGAMALIGVGVDGLVRRHHRSSADERERQPTTGR